MAQIDHSRNSRLAIIWFLVLAFVLNWIVEIPAALVKYRVLGIRIPPVMHTLVQFSPAVAALLTVGWFEGRAGLKTLLRPVVRARIAPAWYAFALLVPLGIEGAVVLAYWTTGHALPAFDPWYEVLLVALLFTPFFIGEELGWRGYFLDRLLQRESPLTATAWVAFLWGLWHLPWYLARGTPFQYIAFLAAVFPASAMFTLIYWRSRSLLPCMLLHSSIDWGASYLLGPLPDKDWAFAWVGLCIVFWIAAIPVLVILGRAHRLATRSINERGELSSC